jgi:hypothetical protein
MKDLGGAPSTHLFAPIPAGTGQTVLREAMRVADHDACPIAQVVQLRKTMPGREASFAR